MQALRLDVDYLGDNYPPLSDEILPKPMNRQNSVPAAGTSSATAGVSGSNNNADPYSMLTDGPRVKFSPSVTTNKY